jgi:predicted nucleic acid-binding protein
MKNSFKEYNPLTPKEIEVLWKNSIFIFDTNILLNLYRYSDETSLKLIETIEALKNIWIPYQVGLEFYRKRLIVISEQKKSFEECEKKNE